MKGKILGDQGTTEQTTSGREALKNKTAQKPEIEQTKNPHHSTCNFSSPH